MALEALIRKQQRKSYKSLCRISDFIALQVSGFWFCTSHCNLSFINYSGKHCNIIRQLGTVPTTESVVLVEIEKELQAVDLCLVETTLPLPLGISSGTLEDCGKDNPETNEEMKKDVITLLTEEISLQKTVIDDNLAHTKALIMDARKSSSHYQKEAEKCNTGMETCEEAREKAEAELTEERKLSLLWENRARENGWLDRQSV
ncbi:hypothetical protein ACET3Z_003076 [Daucus carota]